MMPLKIDTRSASGRSPPITAKKASEIEARIALWRPRVSKSTTRGPLDGFLLPPWRDDHEMCHICAPVPRCPPSPHFSEKKRHRCLRGTRRDAMERSIGSLEGALNRPAYQSLFLHDSSLLGRIIHVSGYSIFKCLSTVQARFKSFGSLWRALYSRFKKLVVTN